MEELKPVVEGEASGEGASPAAMPAGEEGPTEAPRRDAWAKVGELAVKQLDRFMSLEPRVLRGDDPDAIHDIRVASRRLQQILDLLHPPPAPGGIRKLRRTIRRSRRSLSEVRNCDVMIGRVGKILASKRAARRESWTAVRHYLLDRRAAGFEKAARKLSKLNLAVFYVKTRGHLGLNGMSPALLDPGGEFPADPARESFGERVRESLERAWSAFEKQVAESQRDARGPVLHGVRIAAKRLRYLIEVIHEFEVPGSAEALAWLRSLQQHLGDWHDQEVLEQMIVDMVARAEFLREHLELAMGVEKLVLLNRAKKKNYEEKYFELARDAEGLPGVQAWVSSRLGSTAFP